MSTKRRIWTLLFAFILPVLSASDALAAQEKIDLTLEVGEQRVVTSAGVSSYSEGTHGIIDVRLTKDGSSFVVVGQRAGTSTLLMMMDDGRELLYRITVTAGSGKPDERGSDSNTVSARDNVRLDFYFVQVSKDDSHKLGIGWPGAIGGASLSGTFDLLSGSFTDATAVVADQALPHLDMAQSRGWAKLLRQAAVITENGSEAKFAGGGELNVAITGGLSGSLRQIAFGSLIEVLPRYDHQSGRIELTIHADISDLAADGGTGLPGRITSTLSSVVNLELGQSVVLAGLSARSETSSQTGLPWLSQLPILGGLFGSNASRTQDTENLVVIVPTVVDAVSLRAREQVRQALASFDAYEGNLEDKPLARKYLELPAQTERTGAGHE